VPVSCPAGIPGPGWQAEDNAVIADGFIERPGHAKADVVRSFPTKNMASVAGVDVALGRA
jgi:hypothetical protein